MTKAQLTRLVKETYEHWHGIDSWQAASNWRKSDWKKLLLNFCAEVAALGPHEPRPLLPSEIPVPPQPFRPYRADATDSNPED